MDDQIVAHLIDIKENLGRQDERLEAIEIAVTGNGQPGLSQKVEALQQDRKWTWGVGAGITFVLTILESWLHLVHRR